MVPMKPSGSTEEIILKQLRYTLSMRITRGSDMTAFAARFFPKASTKTMAEVETFVSVALFCGVGLLVSLSVLLLDKYIPGEWF
jgi:hypothetical protein